MIDWLLLLRHVVVVAIWKITSVKHSLQKKKKKTRFHFFIIKKLNNFFNNNIQKINFSQLCVREKVKWRYFTNCQPRRCITHNVRAASLLFIVHGRVQRQLLILLCHLRRRLPTSAACVICVMPPLAFTCQGLYSGHIVYPIKYGLSVWVSMCVCSQWPQASESVIYKRHCPRSSYTELSISRQRRRTSFSPCANVPHMLSFYFLNIYI